MPPFQTAESSLATCRGGIKKSLETAFLFTLFFLPSSSLISPVLHPSPKIGLTHFSHFCRAHATSTVLSSLFSPAASLFGSLYMDPTLCTAWRRVTHPCRIPWVQYQTACFPQKDKLRLVMGGPAIFFKLLLLLTNALQAHICECALWKK